MNEECSSQCGGSVYDAARPGDEHWTTTKHNEFLSSYTETPGPPGRGDHWPALRPAGGGWVLRWGEGVFIGFQFSSPQPPAQAAVPGEAAADTTHSQPVPAALVQWSPSRHRLSWPHRHPAPPHIGRSVGRRHAGGQHLTPPAHSVQLETKAKRRFAKISQSQRRPQFHR